MRRKNTTIGLFGVFGIWLTAGLALPFVNILQTFTPPQLMTLRGLITALMAVIVIRGVPWNVDRYTYIIALVLPLATLGLFEGIRAWGVGPTIIILTATPLVNLALSPIFHRKISSASITGLILMLCGVGIARWGGHFNWIGFGWSVFATVVNGALFELFARAEASSMQKCFWAMLGMGSLGLLLSIHDSWPVMNDLGLLLTLTGFAFVGGFLYWIANLVAFENLSTNEVSVLAQGETPAVLLGSYFLLGEQLTLVQWIGVAVSLYGAWHLSSWIGHQDTESATT